MGVAYRILGSRADAEDAVQEAWLRYATAGTDEISDVRAWLTTVTARICLDVLRSARVRRETYVGPWLPEPVVTRLPASGAVAGAVAGPASGLASAASGAAPGAAMDPAERVVQVEEVSLALLVVLERLTPEQRVAFVLHDVFAVPFDEIAGVLNTTPEAARQLASRGRRAIAEGGGPRRRADLGEQRRVLTAFLAAAERGDIEGLLAVLAPDVVSIGDGGGAAPAGRAPIVGALQVARFIAGIFRQAGRGPSTAEPVLVNGDLGLLAEAELPGWGRYLVVIGFAIGDDGRISGIFNQLNPAKLDRVPRPDPDRNLLSHGR
jgi:RNA polymerase sigma-70 factor (ECF subfamily)